MDYLLKASAVIALFYLCFYFLLKKETFFNHNRWFLLIGVIIALVFPFVVIPIHIAVEPIIVPETVYNISENIPVNNQKSIPESKFEWQTLLPLIYGIGLIVFLTQFIFQFGSLMLLLLKNPKNRDGIYTYVIVNNKISPFSFFKWIVYNPESFNNEELKLMLTHEKVHANQLHSIDILLIQLACSIFWFNPLIWFYRKEVRQNLEYIADYITQEKSNSEKEYQRLLLKTSVANFNVSLSNNFYNSLIKERIIMLKKSRSNARKQWRYLLMLPLLAGLLMSMNIEKVYIETDTIVEKNEKTIELVVTKNTTDIELKVMSNAIENKGGTLVFSQIKRNSSNELTSIFLKLNNHSYGGDFGEPIKSFIIYKELFGLGGGYVGRIGGATLHYDNNEKFYDEKTSEQLSNRAHKAILSAGIQTEEELKNIEKKRSDFKKQKNDKRTKPSKSLKTASVNTPNKNNKNIAMAFPKTPKNQPQLIEEVSITLITKQTTDSELDQIKSNLKKEGLTVKYNGVKRNKNNEITAIKIDVSSKKSSVSYTVNSDDAIETIKIVFDKENGSLSIGNANAKHSEPTYIYDSKDVRHKIHKSGKGEHVYVVSEDEHEHDEEHDEEHEHETTFVIKKDGNKAKIRKLKNNDKVVVISENDDLIEIKTKEETSDIQIKTENGKKPLIFVDGKEITKSEMKDIKPNMIESLTVLKDAKAIKKYGKKAKNGVIEIILKKKN